MKRQRTTSKQEKLTRFLCEKKKKKQGDGLSGSQSRFFSCPLCERRFPVHLIEQHAAKCSPSERAPERIFIEDTISESNSLKIAVQERNAGIKTLGSERICNAEAKAQWNRIIKNKKQPQTKNFNHSYFSEPLPGLYIFEDFISEKEEDSIIKHLDGDPNGDVGDYDNQPWTKSKFNGKHKGKRWGAHCSLLDRKVYPEKDPLPVCVLEIIDKVCQLNCFENFVPNEANAIDYSKRAGDYLKSHVDDRQLSKEPIANLSLAGDCYMTFRLERDKKKHLLPSDMKILLKRRTLQVLTGRARYDYSHGIENRDLLTDRRISITMRESPLSR